MTLSEIRQNEIDYCRDNILYFIEKYGHIEDKDAEELIQPFHLWDAQKEALLSLQSNRLNVILKARQLGFTWLVLHYAAHKMLTKTGRTVIGLSRSEDEAKELVRRLAVVLRYMPSFIREKGNTSGWTGAWFEQTSLKVVIHFPGQPESVFEAFPSSPGAVRSFTADLIIFDEWAFQQFAEQIWSSAFPAINRPSGGQFIGLSTNVRGSLFESIFVDKSNSFNKIFIPWYADPKRDIAWYEETKRNSLDIGAEYPATIEEALTVVGGSYFPEVTKQTHVTSEYPDLKHTRNYVCLDYGLDMLSVHWVAVDKNKKAKVYREYDKSDMTIGASCDAILKLSDEEKIEAFLAPSDLWNREQVLGKSRAIIFQENGINLTKTSRDFVTGCANMKEWLKVRENGEPDLMMVEDECPNLYNSLTKIQKDKKKQNVYAKEPHDLTHDPDSLRAFCVWWSSAANVPEEDKRRKWPEDRLEDYYNASPEDRAYLIKRYGEPIL